MLTMADIRDYIASLQITEDDNVYVGKLDSKKEKSIGIYQRKASGEPFVAAGGHEATTYDIKPLTILIHWNKHQGEAERAAFQLWESLRTAVDTVVGKTDIDYIRPMVPEPQDVGTDDKGIYEYVIWIDMIYERSTEYEGFKEFKGIPGIQQ